MKRFDVTSTESIFFNILKAILMQKPIEDIIITIENRTKFHSGISYAQVIYQKFDKKVFYKKSAIFDRVLMKGNLSEFSEIEIKMPGDEVIVDENNLRLCDGFFPPFIITDICLSCVVIDFALEFNVVAVRKGALVNSDAKNFFDKIKSDFFVENGRQSEHLDYANIWSLLEGASDI